MTGPQTILAGMLLLLVLQALVLYGFYHFFLRPSERTEQEASQFRAILRVEEEFSGNRRAPAKALVGASGAATGSVRSKVPPSPKPPQDTVTFGESLPKRKNRAKPPDTTLRPRKPWDGTAEDLTRAWMMVAKENSDEPDLLIGLATAGLDAKPHPDHDDLLCITLARDPEHVYVVPRFREISGLVADKFFFGSRGRRKFSIKNLKESARLLGTEKKVKKGAIE